MRGLGDYLATWNIEISGNTPQMGDSLGDSGALWFHIDGHAPMNCRRCIRSEEPCGFYDQFFRDLGDFCNLAGRIFLNTLFKTVKTKGPFFHKLLIIYLFINNDIEHAKGKGAACSWPELKVVRGPSGHPCVSRVDANDFASQFHAINDPVPVECVGAGSCGIIAPHNNDLGDFPFRIIIAFFQEL